MERQHLFGKTRPVMHWMRWSLCLVFMSLMACGDSPPVGEESVDEVNEFVLHRKDRTGLDFDNVLVQDSSFNVFTYMYFFNGGGLAGGDFNGDGRTDLYFTSNMGPNKLFLNQGDMRFVDATEKAGLQGLEGWTTGASVVDINNDGLLDIYVSQMGEYLQFNGQNQFYICTGIEDGIPQFEDRAAEIGLDLVGFGTQACFFDYDLDGDLDLFQLNHSLHQNGTFGRRKKFDDKPHERAGDRLFRNDSEQGQLRFTEVSREAGIYSTAIGYGLGVVAGDVNLDGWPDLYVGNDFHENDYLYINQKDGTFREELAEQIRYTSRFSMGVDMADVNNDGHSEILSLDMLPADPYILKTSLGEDGYNIFTFKLGHGYHPQFSKNCLQLNNGNGTFSEIAMFSGIFATDWSWAPLLVDFDHDGLKDIFISNGIPRRMNDIDYINFKSSDDHRFRAEYNAMEKEDLTIVEKMPQIKLPNKFFHNNGDLTFQDLDANIQQQAASYSNGAIAADLDNDGDLDVVVNNIDDEPFVYENKQKSKGHAIQLALKGPPNNINAIGARLIAYQGENSLTAEHYPVRGYQSSVQSALHLGIGEVAEIDSLVLIWPDRSYQRLEMVVDSLYRVEWRDGLPLFDFAHWARPKEQKQMALEEIAKEVGIDFVHKENPFVDFNREGLIPHMVSAEGPAVAVGDVDGNGLEDVFLGSSKRKRSALYLQQSNGQFLLATPPALVQDSVFEDVDAVWVDIENDGDLDLVVASGGNEYRLGSEATLQRAYLNDGTGKLERADLFPASNMTASCVLPADVNQDGLVDFFFGARALPRNYGLAPTSMLFENQGNGRFENATKKYSESLAEVGMVTAGSWADLDADGDSDLLLATEWGEVQLFENQGKRLKKRSLHPAKGWWKSLLVHDLDADGDLDILVGNLGKNAKFKPSLDEPLRLYVNDYDDNGQIEQILTYYQQGREIPFATFAELTKQLVSLKKKYLYSKDMANASLAEIFGKDKLAEARTLEVDQLASIWLENTGEAKAFRLHVLPDELQWSPLNAAIALEGDGTAASQLLTAGNFLGSNIET